MLHVHAFNPDPLLRHCVDSYMIISVDQPEKDFIENTFLPDIAQHLVIDLNQGGSVYDYTHSEYCAPHFIVGPNDAICRVRLFPGMKKMIIRFKPGGLFKIFCLPAHYFINRSRNALEFLGKTFADTCLQLRETSISGKIGLIDAWLLKKLNQPAKLYRNIDEAIRLIEQFKGNISLKQLEEATFTTKRTLERHFLEQIGLHPKTFSRLVRFNGVIRYLEANLDVKWRQLADVFGYYDQSHFIHEFKTLTGSLPHDYFPIKTSFEKIFQV